MLVSGILYERLMNFILGSELTTGCEFFYCGLLSHVPDPQGKCGPSLPPIFPIHPSMKPASRSESVISRPGILFFPQRQTLALSTLGCGLLASLVSLQAQTDGRWTGATSGTAPAANFSNTANWLNGIVADGPGATAAFVYNPISDGGTAGSALAGGLIFDTNRTLGHIVFEDVAGYGGATIGYNNPAAPATLTLATTGATVPTLVGGQVLNSQLGGKKIVMNQGLAGTQGFRKLGPGYLSLRGPVAQNTLSGTVITEAGQLTVRSQLPSVSALVARNGGSVELELGAAGVGSINRFPATATLTLGGPDGGGMVYNTAATAPSAHAQSFNGVTLGGGANEIRAVIGGTAPNFQDMTYNLGTVTPGTHATLNLARSAATGTGNFLLTNPNGANGIIGPWLTLNSADWAISSGGLAAAFTGYTANTWASGLHTNATAFSQLNNATTGTLRFNTGNPVILTLTGTNTVETGGIISNQQAPIITGGTLTTGSPAGDLFLHAGGGGSTGLLIQSVIADGASGPLRLTKSLFGIVTLAADNTFTGGTNVGAGILALGTGYGGGTTGSVTGPITLSNLALTGGQFVPNGTLVFNRAGSYTVTNPINPTANAGGFLEQWSTGELILNQASKVGGLRAYSGTTTLDFNAASAPAADLIDGNFTGGSTTIATARFSARNGDLTVKGKAAGNSVQNFALTDSFGASTLTLQPGAGGTVTLNLGALNRAVNSNDGGGVFFYNPVSGARLTTTDSGVNASNPLLGPPYNIPYFVLGGTDWGARDTATNDIVPGSTLPGFHQPLSTIPAGGNADYDAPTTISFDTTLASLRFNTAGGTLTADSTLQPNGILVTPAAGGTTTITGGGTLRAIGGGGTSTATTARDIVIAQMNAAGKLTIGVPVTNFDANNRTELTKAGPGELELTSPNTYTGRTFVGGGIVRLTGSASIGDAGVRTGSVFVRRGELILEQSATIASGAFFSAGQRVGEDGTMTLKDSATFDIAADFNIGDVNSKGTVNVQNDARILTRSFFLGKSGFSIGTLNQSGGLVQQANTSAGDWIIGGNGAGDPLAKGTYNLSGGTFDTGARNFQVGRYGIGEMNVSGGTVTGTAFHVLGRFGTGVGTLNLSGTGTYDAVPAGTGSLYFIIGETGRGLLNISGGATLRARNLSLGHNGGSAVVEQTGGLVHTTDVAAVSGSIGGGVVFGVTVAPGLVLPDYSGSWHLQGGILRTYSVGENTTLTTPFASSFRFDGGTLEATATNGQFLRAIDSVTVEDGGAVIDSAGYDIAIAEPLRHSPALGAVPDGGLTKNGAGSLAFSAANTYTGDTRVTGGTLTLTAGSLADAADVRLSNGALLDLAFSGTDTIDQFYIDGVAQAAGSWGSLTSAATNKTARITSDGILNVTTGPAAATGYAAWAALPVNGLTAGVNDGPTQDPDGDGIANLTEFVLNGNPSQNSAAILPAATVSPATLTLTFKRRDDAEPGTTVILQHSTDLQNWTDVTIGPVSSGSLTVTENGAAADDIVVTLPRNGAVRQYARLKTIVLP